MSDANLHKLITKEDPIHLHKILGAVAFINCMYRYYLLLVYGSMFINTSTDIALVGVHGILSVSSLIFHIPAKRHARLPMIYPEFRLHSIVFALRSVFCCFIEYFITYEYKLYLKMATCIGTMLVADQITRICAQPGDTTMRAMPFSETTDDKSKQLITRFHSTQQVTATLAMMFNVDSAFAPMFAIQFAAFLMTLVRKNIIKPNTWHLLYSWSLMINGFILFSISTSQAILLTSCNYLFTFLRFKRRMNKYVCWSIVFIYMSIFNYNYDCRYVSYAFIAWYLFSCLQATRALYCR
jgi:hypothetical protein